MSHLSLIPQWLSTASMRSMLSLVLLFGTGCQAMFLAAPSMQSRVDSITEEEEIKRAAESYQAVLMSEPRSENAHLEQMVVRVGRRLADVAERPDFQWRFHLFGGSRRHAFCLPGGKVGVFEGALPICECEGGIAALMSHEIAHVLSRHGAERMAGLPRRDENSWHLDRLVRNGKAETLANIRVAYGVGHAPDGNPLPFSHSLEVEADTIGMLLMARAGYDPQEAPRFWTRLSRQPGRKMPELLVSHPLNDVRHRSMLDTIPQAISVYQSAPQRHGLGERIPMKAIAALIPLPNPEAAANPETPAEASAPATDTPSATPQPPPEAPTTTTTPSLPAAAPAAAAPAPTAAAPTAPPASADAAPATPPAAAASDAAAPAITPEAGQTSVESTTTSSSSPPQGADTTTESEQKPDASEARTNEASATESKDAKPVGTESNDEGKPASNEADSSPPPPPASVTTLEDEEAQPPELDESNGWHPFADD